MGINTTRSLDCPAWRRDSERAKRMFVISRSDLHDDHPDREIFRIVGRFRSNCALERAFHRANPEPSFSAKKKRREWQKQAAVYTRIEAGLVASMCTTRATTLAGYKAKSQFHEALEFGGTCEAPPQLTASLRADIAAL
jgi:hypothetical protein